jgi:hypothetical protein
VAELADAQDLGSCGREAVRVQLPPSASLCAGWLLTSQRGLAYAASNAGNAGRLELKLKLLTSSVVIAVIATVTLPIFAHHGSAVYDTSKAVVLKDVTVTKFIWANPHSIAMFDTKDEKGNVVHWAAEAGSPSALSLIGWTKNSIKPGDVITVYVFQSKTGSPVGRLNKIVLSDGTSLKDSALGDQKYDKTE